MMAEMTGSPRQIAWAEDIRRTAIAALQSAVDDYTAALAAGQFAVPEEMAKLIDALGDTMGELRRQDSAKWWIDHRGSDWVSDVREQVREEVRGPRPPREAPPSCPLVYIDDLHGRPKQAVPDRRYYRGYDPRLP